MKTTQRTIFARLCLVAFAACAVSAQADREYGLVEAVVAANEADVNATYEPFRPDKPFALAGSSIGAVRDHDPIDDTTVCWTPSNVYRHERWGVPHTAKTYVGVNVCSHDVLGGSLFRDLTLDVAPPQGTFITIR